MRRVGVFVVVAALLAGACTSVTGGRNPDRGGPDRDTAFVSERWFQGRQDDYLRFATEQYSPGSPLNVLAHVERARRDPSFHVDLAAVTPEVLAPMFTRIDTFQDTTDFDMLYLLNLWFAARDQLPADTRAAIEQRFLSFKYWYDEPTPAGIIDQKWYWSENHRIIFHALEYLVGQEFPNAVFTNDGRTGAEHREHARRMIEEWIVEKARFGFSEWHSDVYYQKDVTPLLTLAEWSKDRGIATRASMVLDLVLFDIALHLQKGNMGATHGRSYMKDKSIATDQDVFGVSKLLFDDTTLPYQSRGDAASMLARSRRYRMPEVIRRVARSPRTTVDREHMNVPLDELAPVTPNPPGPFGFSFDDPENVDFWWERGALTAWQIVPLTLSTADRYNLWETDFFQPFQALRALAGDDPVFAQNLARQLARMIAFAVLKEVDTYTYRAPEVMLSTAQDYRAGSFGDQYHAWQATLDEQAIVFTTHPKNAPQTGTQWPDEDGYWTGTGSMPRSAQEGAAAIHIYAPQFASPGPGLLEDFSYLPETHAFFPQERFDEVVQDGNWTFGRKGNGYVALWSWRPTHWRASQPGEFTDGLTQPFDLVADGGADDVWITQVGEASEGWSFAEFREEIADAPLSVTPLGSSAGISNGFDVRYVSPSEGEMRFSWTGPLMVNGEPVDVHDVPRYDNPWTWVDRDEQQYRLRDGRVGLWLDFTSSQRRAFTR